MTYHFWIESHVGVFLEEFKLELCPTVLADLGRGVIHQIHLDLVRQTFQDPLLCPRSAGKRKDLKKMFANMQ